MLGRERWFQEGGSAQCLLGGVRGWRETKEEAESGPPVCGTLALSSIEMKYVHVLGVPCVGRSKRMRRQRKAG